MMVAAMAAAREQLATQQWDSCNLQRSMQLVTIGTCTNAWCLVASGGPEAWHAKPLWEGATANKPRGRSAEHVSAMSTGQQQRLRNTHVQLPKTGEWVHKERYVAAQYKATIETTNQKGRNRFQQVAMKAAVGEDTDGTGFYIGRYYQVRRVSLQSHGKVQYDVELCSVRELRKAQDNGLVMRLSLKQADVDVGYAVIQPLCSQQNEQGGELLYHVDKMSKPSMLVSLKSLGCEVEMQDLSSGAPSAVHATGQLMVLRSYIESHGGKKLQGGVVNASAFGGQNMRVVDKPIDKLTVADLKLELGARNMRKQGRKGDLLLRLREAIIDEVINAQQHHVTAQQQPVGVPISVDAAGGQLPLHGVGQGTMGHASTVQQPGVTVSSGQHHGAVMDATAVAPAMAQLPVSGHHAGMPPVIAAAAPAGQAILAVLPNGGVLQFIVEPYIMQVPPAPQ